MSELRRPSTPADRPENVDRPAERDGRPRPVDQPAFQPIDYRKTIRAQKDFVRETPAQPPEARKPPASLDWMTGRPPPGLEARTLERTEPPNQAERFSELNVRKRRADRVVAEVSGKVDDITSAPGYVFNTFEDLMNSRPPAGIAITHSRETPHHLQPYGTHTAGDIAMGVAAGGLALTEIGRRIYDKLRHWR